MGKTSLRAVVPPSALRPVATKTGTTYTLLASDSGKTLRFTNASPITVTCPNSLPIGFEVNILQAGTGQVTCLAGSGASVQNAHSYVKTYGLNAMIGLAVDINTGGAAAHYVLVGDGA